MTIPMVRRLLRDLAGSESGQDVIEYALLTAAIGIVGILAWQAIEGGIFTAYGSWDSGTQSLWEPPNPGGGS